MRCTGTTCPAIAIPTASRPRAPQALDHENPPCAGDHDCATGKLPDAAHQGLQYRKNVNHVMVTDANANADADAVVEN